MDAEAFRDPPSESELELHTTVPVYPPGAPVYHFRARFDITLETAIKNYDYLTFPSIRQQVINHLIPADQPLAAFLAQFQGQVVGMALVQLQAEKQLASLRSICVLPEHRRRGVGSGLLHCMEQVMAQQGYRRLEFTYQTNWSNYPVVMPILEKRGWIVRPHQLVLRITREQLAQAPILKQYPMPQGFIVFPWVELTLSERQWIQQRQAAEGWYSPEQDPFQSEPFIELQSSIGLRHQGQIIGWKIHHRFTPDTVRRMLLFLSPEYRGQGVGAALLIESLRRYLNTRIPFYTTEVEAGNSRLVKWWQRHLVPQLAELVEAHRAEKQLLPLID
jgi:GNAT superfamily N-acetyltransferase